MNNGLVEVDMLSLKLWEGLWMMMGVLPGVMNESLLD
jgi:hypothetical protein